MNSFAKALVIAALFTGTPALALTVDAQSGVSGGVQTDHTGVSVEAQGSLDAGSAMHSDNSSHTSAEANPDADMHAEAGLGPIIIKAGDADDTTGASVTSSAMVRSSTELKSYAHTVVKTHADVRDVELSQNEVSVSHKEKAYVFGIFPITVFARTSVDNSGNVTVAFPWYTFASAKKAEIEAKIKAAVSASIPPVSAQGTAHASFSTTAEAEVLDKAIATLSAQFQADTAAKVTTN